MILVGPSGDVVGFCEISLGSSFVAVAVPAGLCSVPAQQDITSHRPKSWESSGFVRDVPAAVSASSSPMTGSSMAQDFIQNIVYLMMGGFA